MVYFKPLRLNLIINVMKTACTYTYIHIYIHSPMKCNFFSALKCEHQYTPSMPCFSLHSICFLHFTSLLFFLLASSLLPHSCPLSIPSFPLLSLFCHFDSPRFLTSPICLGNWNASHMQCYSIGEYIWSLIFISFLNL